ncbi:uncharacterized protein LOC142548324 [Primulina tabacum]|uniref:uncharacterized protein LOC142548324 n=1 Tax=Primulina tabacum TaxID=48773 RepID=UPI003F59805D
MNFLIWNIRGLRGSESQQRLHAFVKEKQIKVLTVLEPMIDLDQRFMTRRLGFSRVISNLSGHIWVFFAADVQAECVLDHAQFLHIKVSAPFLPTSVFCSFVYARCDYIERRVLWSSLLHVKPVLGPWIIGGDFNVVRDASEFLGTRGGRLLPMEEFNTFIMDSSLLDAGFEGLIGISCLFVKMKRLKNHLKWWNWDVFGNIFDKITEAESAVRSAELACEADPSDSNWTTLSDSNADLARVTAMEADFWKQKAAYNWLEDGERNTKLFHNMVKKKRVANKIFRIWNDGVCLTSPELIQQSGVSFFQHLLTRDPFVLDCPDFSGFPSVISDEENYGITATPSLEEDVLDAVLDFFRGSPLPQSFTATTITLIPKIEGAQAWSDFRPISLCNVTNKIISKLLYSRLRAVAERLISLNQTGFVPGRMISDNILLAQELTHSLTIPTHGGNVILKLWRWSLPVFLIAISPLISMVLFRGSSVLPGASGRETHCPPFSSSLGQNIFRVALTDSTCVILLLGTRRLDFMHHYENSSGQLVNAVKSSLILPPQCSERLRSRLLRITGFAEGHLPIKYLGVPLFGGIGRVLFLTPLTVVQPPLAVWRNLREPLMPFFAGLGPWRRNCIGLVGLGLASLWKRGSWLPQIERSCG